ncbi:MAG: lysophospholipid acyltransferase family protein [Spirochaetota bacterium]
MSKSAGSGDREIRLSKSFFLIARKLYGIPIKKMYNLATKNAKEAFALKPPYILLSNHVNTFDPIIISIMHKRPVQWVAADTLFRNKYLRYMMRRLIGSISKSKSRSDYYTIKQITGIIRKGGVVGMFPEGQRTWDGRSLPLFYATAKLVRMLRVPVVLCTLEGGYHSLPRWSNKRRKGRLTVSYQAPLMPEEFAGMGTDDIYQLLTERLYHDAYEFQRKHWVRFKSNSRAEYLEHVLYLCPGCGSLDTIRSSGNSIGCTHCGFEAEVDAYGFFVPSTQLRSMQSPAEWNSWQRHKLRERILNGEWDDGKTFFPGDVVLMFVGYRDERMKKIGEVKVNMSISGITASTDSQQYDFPFQEIDSLTVAMQRNLEFYHQNSMYRLKFPAPRASAYKFLALYEITNEAKKSLKERISM